MQIDEAVHHDELVLLEKLYNAFTKVDLAAGNQVINAEATVSVLHSCSFLFLRLSMHVKDKVGKFACFFLALAF